MQVDCYWHHFLTNITQYSLQFLRSTSRTLASWGCACTRERANACGLIVNDSSAKRMHAQQPGENASCASAGRNSESDQTVGFSDSLFLYFSLSFSVFFLASRRERGHARLSSTQSAVPGAENNEAVRRNVKFSVTSTIHGIAHRFEIVILLPIIDNYTRGVPEKQCVIKRNYGGHNVLMKIRVMIG